jgi:hypothetical protein
LLRLRLPPEREPERAYAANVVLQFLGLDVPIERGDAVEFTDGESTLRLADVLFRLGTDVWLKPASLPRTPLERCDGVPVPYGERLGDGSLRRPGELGVDVFGSAFFCLTRYEEAVLPDRDARDRFPASATLAAREGFADRAVVDELVDLLWLSLHELWPRLERRRSEFRVLPSHDVDGVRSRLRWLPRDLATRHDPLLAARRAVSVVRPGLDPAWSFDMLMRESEQRGLRSAFYFIADSSSAPEAADYRLDDPRLLRLLRRISERGHEIGLHPSYRSYDDPAKLLLEAEALRAALAAAGVEQERIGGRQHWLRWTNPLTWRAWAEAGLVYDSTLGWPDRVGFRTGTCREYQVFDLGARRPLALSERPLVVMDSAVTNVAARPSAGAGATIAAAKETCRRHRGDFTILWHNEWALSRSQLRLYRGALDA